MSHHRSFDVGDIVRCDFLDDQYPEDKRLLAVGQLYEVTAADGLSLGLKGVFLTPGGRRDDFPYWDSKKFSLVRSPSRTKFWLTDDLWETQMETT